MKNKIESIVDKVISINRNRTFNNNLKKLMTEDIKKSLNKVEIDEVNKYWSQYTNQFNIDFFKYYKYRTGHYNKRYIPDNIYYSTIDMYFNNRVMANVIDNKNYYDKI